MTGKTSGGMEKSKKKVRIHSRGKRNLPIECVGQEKDFEKSVFNDVYASGELFSFGNVRRLGAL
jgi:hypothetical protein